MFIKTVPLKLKSREYSESREGISTCLLSIWSFLVCWSQAVGFDFGAGRVHICYLCTRVPQQETSHDVMFIEMVASR